MFFLIWFAIRSILDICFWNFLMGISHRIAVTLLLKHQSITKISKRLGNIDCELLDNWIAFIIIIPPGCRSRPLVLHIGDALSRFNMYLEKVKRFKKGSQLWIHYRTFSDLSPPPHQHISWMDIIFWEYCMHYSRNHRQQKLQTFAVFSWVPKISHGFPGYFRTERNLKQMAEHP